MGTKFTEIYDRFFGKITDDMYMEYTPLDTLKDLRSLILNAIPGFEFPRKVLSYKLDGEILNITPLISDTEVKKLNLSSITEFVFFSWFKLLR